MFSMLKTKLDRINKYNEKNKEAVWQANIRLQDCPEKAAQNNNN